MRTVYKYELRIEDEQVVRLPAGARLLSVGVQTDDSPALVYRTLSLWALVDTQAPPVARRVYIVGTGHPAGHVASAEYVGTVNDALRLVWHVFAEREG